MKMASRVTRKESHNYYAVLGLAQNATAADIRAAYRRKALSTHPDKGGSPADFLLVLKAFEVLFSGHSRASYDAKLEHRFEQPEANGNCEESRRVPRTGVCKTLAKTKRRRSKSQILERCLRQLQSILKDCPHSARLQQIQMMSQLLRTTLLDFIERSKREGQISKVDGRVSSHGADSELDTEAVGDIGKLSHAGNAGATRNKDNGKVMLPIEDLKSGAQETRAECSHWSGRSRRQKDLMRGIYSISASNQVYYESRVTHRNLCLASRVSRSLEDVVNFHATLISLRQRMVELEDLEPTAKSDAEATEPWLARLKCAMLTAVHEVEGVDDIGLSFQVVLDARPWVGKMLHSPRMHCAKTALDVWQRAESVRLAQGWNGIKAVWTQWMQAERRSCWAVRKRSRQEAEATVRWAENAFSATRQRRQAIQKKREAAQKRRNAELQEREEKRAKREKEKAETAQARMERLTQNKLPRCIHRAEVLVKSLQAKERSAQRPRSQAAHRQVRVEPKRRMHKTCPVKTGTQKSSVSTSKSFPMLSLP